MSAHAVAPLPIANVLRSLFCGFLCLPAVISRPIGALSGAILNARPGLRTCRSPSLSQGRNLSVTTPSVIELLLLDLSMQGVRRRESASISVSAAAAACLIGRMALLAGLIRRVTSLRESGPPPM